MDTTSTSRTSPPADPGSAARPLRARARTDIGLAPSWAQDRSELDLALVVADVPRPPEELTVEEQRTVDLIWTLKEARDLRPLVKVLCDGDIGPDRAREVLRVLGELDLDLLVQVALDTLIDGFVKRPRPAVDNRRAIHAESPRAARPASVA